MIKFTCEQCKALLQISDDCAGKDGQCPICLSALKIPSLKQAEVIVASPAISASSVLSKDGIAAFVSELATYYMDFLETDFHKRRVPKRSVKLHNSKNMRVGLNLAKYDAFRSSVLKVLESGMARSLSVPKNKYRAVVSQKVRDIIATRTRSVTDEVVEEVAANISKKIIELANPNSIDIGDALSSSQDFVTEAIRSRVVTPFVSGVESLLEGADIESVYSMEESLVAILTDPLEELVAEGVANVNGGQPEDIANQITQVLDGAFVRDSIESYFSSCSLSDLFFEIKELADNNLILDKEDLYLYFCDIHFDKGKYPLFYVPLTITKTGKSFKIECEPTAYINKKAVEYIVQEYNKERKQKGTIQSIAERIIYPQESMLGVFGNILSDITKHFRLSPDINLEDTLLQKGKGRSVVVSNSMYICIFDKSDEALVNDYEEILDLMKSENAELIDSFTGLINDFICTSPKSFRGEVDDEWDRTPPEEKLVFSSPIPLNPEQRQILKALDKPDCKYIAVEGPPGTGKSHTITAILFDAILRNQSVLMLSDKKEALDVVEDKITDVMNKVRAAANFQNPILRLGKAGNTYSQILSTTSLNQIRMHSRAAASHKEDLEKDLERFREYLTTNIDATVASYGKVDIEDIQTLASLDCRYASGKKYPIDFSELLKLENSIDHVAGVWQSMAVLDETLHDDADGLTLLDLFHTMCGPLQEVDTFRAFLDFLKLVQELRETHQDRSFLKSFRTVTREHLSSLTSLIVKYGELGSGFFGYILKGKKVEKLSQEMQAALCFDTPVSLREDIDDLERANKFFWDALNALKGQSLQHFLADPLPVIHELMLPDDHLLDKVDLDVLSDDLKKIISYSRKYPSSAEMIGLSPSNLHSFFDNALRRFSEDEFNDMLSHVFLYHKLSKAFQDVPRFDYTGGLSCYQELLANQMTNILDNRLLDFCDNDKATASTLRGIIKKKKRFPRDDFEKLKKAFPCIVAGIRDYAEYVPLEPGIFDIVIIDEASQVSIAQAFPALLRAKKVVVLGDKKQFSNVKTAHARSDTNKVYMNRLETSFRKNISTGPGELQRFTNFNIKTSILEFFDFIANFDIMLRKHFRGYRELISYSSKHFYDCELQAIRIRGKSIEDTIKFSRIQHDGKQELVKNANSLECEFILNQLRDLKANDSCCSVGIITPHTNQQRLISSAVSDDPDQDYYYESLKLKIMTFDTCQGEEKDIIIYSMVASPVEDKLWAVFIKDLDGIDLEEGGQIKAQRLNVGFSRAKECMHFVHSKPIKEFRGAIGQALRHYEEESRNADKLPCSTDVDSRSSMEVKVLDWIKNTAFFQANSSDIVLKAQFPIGDYLKQLDPFYDHPAYRVDFLLLYKDGQNRQHNIIIEYDGFNEHFGHFTQNEDVDEFNYDSYYSADHVEREKVLEGYGYKFLRVNRFNLGKDPVATLSARLLDLTRPKPKLTFAKAVRRLVASQEVGRTKECPRCGILLPISAFTDSSLTTGIGRICSEPSVPEYLRQPPWKN